ncbi:ATP synthase subunit d, mitochondrial [Calliopsis andreniformis]|uniref:ATP synthase subunit d, mitochondrial n=1 Tax=Calliopsis andreniformis TaxID=337506 RepID=UPI003FCE2AF3
MSRRAIKSINWATLAERIPESEKNAFSAFKSKSDQYLRRMTANPESAPKIDWGYYKKTVATPSLIDKFQKEYEALSIPYPADKYTAQIDSQEKEALVKMEQFMKEADKKIAESQSEIERVKNLLPFSEMTMEDFKDMYPEHAIDRENPTFWPHTEETQPAAIEKMAAAESKSSH